MPPAKRSVFTLILLIRTLRMTNLSRFAGKFRELANRLYVSNEEATQRGLPNHTSVTNPFQAKKT